MMSACEVGEEPSTVLAPINKLLRIFHMIDMIILSQWGGIRYVCCSDHPCFLHVHVHVLYMYTRVLCMHMHVLHMCYACLCNSS